MFTNKETMMSSNPRNRSLVLDIIVQYWSIASLTKVLKTCNTGKMAEDITAKII